MRITSLTYLTMSFSQVYLIILKNTGKEKLSSGIGIVIALINVFLNFILIFGHLGMPAMGVAGAGLFFTIKLSAGKYVSSCLAAAIAFFKITALFFIRR